MISDRKAMFLNSIETTTVDTQEEITDMISQHGIYDSHTNV